MPAFFSSCIKSNTISLRNGRAGQCFRLKNTEETGWPTQAPQCVSGTPTSGRKTLELGGLLGLNEDQISLVLNGVAVCGAPLPAFLDVACGHVSVQRGCVQCDRMRTAWGCSFQFPLHFSVMKCSSSNKTGKAGKVCAQWHKTWGLLLWGVPIPPIICSSGDSKASSKDQLPMDLFVRLQQDSIPRAGGGRCRSQ